MKIILLLLFIFSSLTSFVSSYGIVGFLEDHGEDIEYEYLNWHFRKYVKQYMAITRVETGRIGIYFHLLIYSTAIGLTIFCTFVWRIFKSG